MGEFLDLLVIGDAMIDITIKAPETQPGGAYPSEILVAPGGLANVAVSASLSGAKAGFLGMVGEDILGDFYESDLESQGIPSYLFRCGVPTGMCVNLVLPNGERTMYTTRGANDFLAAKDISEDVLCSCRMVYISGFSIENDRSAKEIEIIIRRAKLSERQVAIGGGAFNIIKRRRRRLSKLIARHADILILNQKEALSLTGMDELKPAIHCLKRIIDSFVVTMGRDGSIGFFQGSEIHAPAAPTPVVDTTGAGDVFTGTFLAGILKGKTPAESMKLANQNAGESVSLLGPRMGLRRKSDSGKHKSQP